MSIEKKWVAHSGANLATFGYAESGKREETTISFVVPDFWLYEEEGMRQLFLRTRKSCIPDPNDDGITDQERERYMDMWDSWHLISLRPIEEAGFMLDDYEFEV